VFQKKIPATEFDEAGTLSGLNASAQHVRKGFEAKGYAEVTLFQKDEEQFPERAKLLEVIADCLDRGHRLRDIALLTPRNSDVIRVSGWLNGAGIRFISHSSLDIRTRKITGEIIALLQFLDSPIDDLSFASFLMSDLLQSALKHGSVLVTREQFQSLIFNARHEGRSPLYKVFQERYGEVWDRCFADLYGTVGYLPLYDLISEVYKVFEVFEVSPENEGTLVKLLEVVKAFEESGNNSVKEFLAFAQDEGTGWDMDVPMDDDAITLMTVHKAKGLDFPVVVVLLYDSGRRKKEYYVDEAEDGIRLLHISKKSTEKVAYLETIYNRERLKDEVDELNKLYVALTRAKEEMYVLGVYDKERGEPTRFLPDREFPPGPKPTVVRKSVEPKGTLSTHHHNKRRIYEPKAGGKLGLIETRRGELVHAVLSQIEFVGQDLAAQLNAAMGKLKLLIDPYFTASEINSTVRAFLSDRGVKELFSAKPGRIVFREKDFANASGLLYRMDRMVVDPDTVTVIDFKTGGDELEEEYRGQVRNYMVLLRQMYPGKNVRGVIAYVDKHVMREVK